MINMRVAQHHRVQFLRGEREIAIALDGFVALALEQSTFEQQPLAVDFEKIHRTRGRARGAKEMNLHGVKMRTRRELSSLESRERWGD
jgi:hypothetical protein